MKKSMHYRLIAWFLAAFIALMPSLAVAHSGRTDANGGHFNRETGEYHYHGGNGSSGGDSNSSSSRKNKKSNKSKKSNSDKKDTKKRNTESIIGNKNNTNSSAEKKRSTWEHVKEIPCEITLEWELKLYEKPDSKSRIIGTVMQGSKVVLERETRYFYRVKADGVSGYLRKKEINAKITESLQ